MKKYLLPLVLSITINAVIVLLIFYNHHHNQQLSRQPAFVKVSLNKKLIQKHDHAISAKQWLSTHYHNQININQRFTVDKHITGYVVSLKSAPQAKSIIYSFEGGKYYFLGSLIDKNGKSISIKNTNRFIHNQAKKSIYLASKNLHGIIEGNPKKPIFTIIIDPNDALFPQIWDNLITDISQNVFAVNWVLVNYIKPMGPNVAAYILQSKNPVTALEQSATHYNKDTQTAGYKGSIDITPKTIHTLQSNWNFIQKFQLYQLPLTIAHQHNKFFVLHGFIMDETLEMIANNEA